MKNKPISVLAASLLMIILGLARGSGGVILLLEGRNVLPHALVKDSTITLLAVWLLLIVVMELVSAIGIYLLKRVYWIIGIITSALFVINGMVNGYLLSGQPGDMGTTVNVVFAALIILFLYLSRGYFYPQKKIADAES